MKSQKILSGHSELSTFLYWEVTELHLLAQQVIQLLTTVETGGFGI